MPSSIISFDQLGLNPAVLLSLTELGYEEPTPVQAQAIPLLLEHADVLAQAQTGTGKTAAFALPALSNINLDIKEPQVLVIAPTRELAIQVAEAFQSYAKHLKGFHVAPIYGGQDYNIQLKALKRGTHVIVGTPGRIMDHLRRNTLSLKALKMVVLDEADEMLKMGFIDDIEWILEQIPEAHQTALFSATLPPSIQNIAKRYLKDAKKVHIKPTEMAVQAIEQFYIRTTYPQKLDVLTRFLEVEAVEAAIVFARTKTCSDELAEKLQARGYAAAALNGDMKQALRQKVIDKTKSGAINIIVATDVAARGIDIDRITHVFNFDIPHDVESYTHRIGRTGRAGRKGKALLFVTPREMHLLKDIERATQALIQPIDPPSLKQMNEIRSKQLIEKVVGVIEKTKTLSLYQEMVEQISEQTGHTLKDIAAAVVYLLQQSNPMPASTGQEQIYGRDNDKAPRARPSRHEHKKFIQRTDASGHRDAERRKKHGAEQGERHRGASRHTEQRDKKPFARREPTQRTARFTPEVDNKPFHKASKKSSKPLSGRAHMKKKFTPKTSYSGKKLGLKG